MCIPASHSRRNGFGSALRRSKGKLLFGQVELYRTRFQSLNPNHSDRLQASK
ncbi:hypothetical protein CERZMDRAFT_90952 [Cercospora zeae-maydis SCOH1-5]|uniref:Uncharacterized protein n=1 Tax=Cercospora zeae-maydis SCOH1-5 TaxID=717836 RepID=A0A6A6FCT0_9PEZI|nr:hypothetical protein CERZMDRAFT_90952 [Cercospora zeae-maydis SCOH1-5]